VKRKGLNSATTLIALARQDVVSTPADIKLTPEEAALWPDFASTRARADWRAFDLRQLGKVVKLEAAIWRHQAMLDDTGPIIRQANGTQVANPLISIIEKLQRQQLSLMRALSLMDKADGRTLAGRASRTRTFTQALESDVHGLMAR
jgi:hypothetical protein